MRILAVTPYYVPEGGGLERYAHHILSRLVSRGHGVHVLAFRRADTPQEPLAGVALERRAPRWRIANTPLDPGFSGRVARAISSLEPDVVVAHTPVPFAAEMAFLAARRAGVPFVVTYHAGRLRGSSPFTAPLAALDRHTLERRMLAGAARLIAVSPYVRDRALSRHADRVAIVPPGVDVERFSPGGPPAVSEVLFVGPLDRSYRWKGVDVLLEAFELVRTRVPEARLVLVGDGDRMGTLVRRTRHLDGAVAFPGRLSEEALVASYRRAAATVLPSTTDAESFGMVLAEANACGRPVVASRIGGIPSLVRHGENGLLARPGDPRDLAGRIVELLDDPIAAAAMGRRGRQRVVRDHDWNDLAVRTEAILLEAVGWSVDRPSPATSRQDPEPLTAG